MKKILLSVSLVLVFLVCAEATGQQSYVISSDNPVSIRITADDALTRLAADRLASYIEAVTGRRPPLTIGPPSGEDEIALRIEAKPYIRPDAYQIRTEQARRSVLLHAPEAPGFKYAVQELILRMEQEGRTLIVPDMSVERNPWMKSRELFLAEIEWHPTESEKAILEELRQRFDWLHWEWPRLQRYIDMTDAMGYNAIMLSDAEVFRIFAGDATPSHEALEKVQSMLKYAREQRGMGTSFFVWGQKGAGQEPRQTDTEGRSLVALGVAELVKNPRAPEQYRQMLHYYESLIRDYAPWVDKWIMHWADPGGCKIGDCTVNTPQVATNEFYRLLRSAGFSSDVSFSLWALRWGAWPGYKDWTSVVDSGILHPEIGINLMRHFNYATAKAIAGQHRLTGVWGWYSNDMETNPGLHVHAKILENEFKRVHKSASVLLDWYSLEDNNHVLNLPSLYVGGRMLWDTQTDGESALLDFCRAVWGPEVGREAFKALRAIEEVRSGRGFPMLNHDLWPDAYMPALGWVELSPVEAVAQCEAALKKLEGVRVDARFVPKLPLIVEPQELLDQVYGHLLYVRDFARVRLHYETALRRAWEGQWEEARKGMLSLPVLADSVPGSYGALEYGPYRILKGFAESWKDRDFKGNKALGKRVTASGWYKNDPRFSPEMAVNGILCEFTEEGWAADTSGPAWLKIDLGRVEIVREVRIFNRGYRREFWDNNLIATPTQGKVFFAVEDPDPSNGTIDDQEHGYRLFGEFDSWEPTQDPAARQIIALPGGVQARYIKVLLFSAANGNATGTGEIEVR